MLKTIYTEGTERNDEGMKQATISGFNNTEYVWLRRECINDDGDRHIEQIRLTKADVLAIAEALAQ